MTLSQSTVMKYGYVSCLICNKISEVFRIVQGYINSLKNYQANNKLQNDSYKDIFHMFVESQFHMGNARTSDEDFSGKQRI